jgi:hypothetical protein
MDVDEDEVDTPGAAFSPKLLSFGETVKLITDFGQGTCVSVVSVVIVVPAHNRFKKEKKFMTMRCGTLLFLCGQNCASNPSPPPT